LTGRNRDYTLRYGEADADAALEALGVAVAHFRPEGELTEGETEGDTPFGEAPCRIECARLGFTAVCDVACATHWDPNDGLYVLYLVDWGRPPYVLIWVAGQTDIPAFFREAVTPAMTGRYGEDLLEVIDCGNITVGRRMMTGYGYRYRSDGGVVYMLRVLENRDGRSVSFIMKYPEGDEVAREKGMAALASIADSFQRN